MPILISKYDFIIACHSVLRVCDVCAFRKCVDNMYSEALRW